MKNPLFYILFFLCAACTQQTKENGDEAYPIHIALRDFEKTENTINNLSAIADSMWYVRLETHPEGLVSAYNDVHVIPDGFLVLGPKRIVFFDQKGRYLHTLSAQGKGPQEYIRISPYSGIDRKEKLLYIPSFHNSLLVFNFRGEVVKSFRTEDNFTMAAVLPDENIFLGDMMLGTPSLILSKDGDELNRYTQKLDLGTRTYPNSGGIYFPRLWLANTTEGLWGTVPDSTFLYSKNGQRDPLFVFDPFIRDGDSGAYTFTLEPLTNNYFGISSTTFYGFYSIPDAKMYLAGGKHTKVLTDDIDGGPVVSLRGAYDGLVINPLAPVELLHPDEGAQQPGARLQAIIKQLNENDNPILRIIRLKPSINH